MALTFIDLFAGIGGMRLAFEVGGGECVLTSELNEDALTTYRLNYHPRHHHLYFNDGCQFCSKSKYLQTCAVSYLIRYLRNIFRSCSSAIYAIIQMGLQRIKTKVLWFYTINT